MKKMINGIVMMMMNLQDYRQPLQQHQLQEQQAHFLMKKVLWSSTMEQDFLGEEFQLLMSAKKLLQDHKQSSLEIVLHQKYQQLAHHDLRVNKAILSVRLLLFMTLVTWDVLTPWQEFQ